jgi:hypothetical protein
MGDEKKPRRSSSSKSSEEGSELGLDLPHDPAKYGSPLQSWVTANKAICLLFVTGKVIDRKELGAGVAKRPEQGVRLAND